LRVSVYAGLRPIVGGKSVEIELPDGATVRQLIDELIRSWPDLGPYLLEDDGELSRRVNIVIDGRSVRYLTDGLSTPLASEHEIAIFPALAGGAIGCFGSLPGNGIE
jgi:molybdopterin synthase sulfur carrier subunit